MEVPKSTKAAANKDCKVFPKQRSSSPPPLELVSVTSIVGELNQRLVDQMVEQSKVNSELLGAISSLQQSIAIGSPLAPPGPTGSGAGAGSHGSAVFRPDSSATDSSSSSSSKAKGRLCFHLFPLNPNQMMAGPADYWRVLDEMAMQRLVQKYCDGAMDTLNEKKQYSTLFEIIGDILAEIILTTDSVPTNGRWATTYTIILLLVITQLQ
jgi:hypothetical protein